MSIESRLSYIDWNLRPDLKLSPKEASILKAHVLGASYTGVRRFFYVIFEGLKSLFFCSNKQQSESFLATHIARKIVTETELGALDRNQTDKSKPLIFSQEFLNYADKVTRAFLTAIVEDEPVENIVNRTNLVAREAFPLDCFQSERDSRGYHHVEDSRTPAQTIFDRSINDLYAVPLAKNKNI